MGFFVKVLIIKFVVENVMISDLNLSRLFCLMRYFILYISEVIIKVRLVR